MQVRAGINQIAVRLKELYKTKADSKILDLDVDPMYNPDFNIYTSAEIVSLPWKVDKQFQQFIDSIKEEGLTHVHYDFKAINPEEYFKDGDDLVFFILLTAYEGVLPSVFCATNPETGDMVLNTGVVFCTPAYPDDVQEIDTPSGKTMARVSPGGLVMDMNPKPDDRIAFVAHPGETELNAGDKVFRDVATNYEYDIDGQKYYLVHPDCIWGVIDSSLDYSRPAPKVPIREVTPQDKQDQLEELMNHKPNFRMA